MNSRAFRHPIEVMSMKPQADSMGNQVEKGIPYHKCRANVNSISGKEYMAAAHPVEEGEVTFEIRYCKDLADLNTTEYFIMFRGERYDISYIDNYLFGDDTLKIRARRGRA